MKLGKNKFGIKRLGLILVLTVSVYIIADAVNTTRFTSVSLDMISYVTFAEQYAAGRFDAAVNALHSPLISLLSAPFIYFGLRGIDALLIVNMLAGMLTIGVVAFTIWRQTKGNLLSTVVSIATLTPVIAWLATVTTPDVLVVMFSALLIATLIMSEAGPTQKLSHKRAMILGVAIGLIGALGILAKLFFLPFFVATIIAWMVIRLLGNRSKTDKLTDFRYIKKSIALPVFSLVLAFLFLIPWMGAMYVKYDRVSLGSSFGAHISSRVGGSGASANVSGGNSIFSPPANDYHTRYKESVSGYREVDAPLAGPSLSLTDRLKFIIEQRLEVIPRYTAAVSNLSPYIIITAILLFVAVLYKKLPYRRHSDVVLAGTLGAIYYAGYAMITVSFNETDGGPIRYYVPLLVFATITICLTLPILWTKLRTTERLRRVLFILLVVGLPLLAVHTHMPKTNGFFTPPSKHANFVIAEHITNHSDKRGDLKLAGNNRRALDRIAFYAHGQTFGSIGPDKSLGDNDVLAALDEHDIDYFIDFTPIDDREPVDLPAGASLFHDFEPAHYQCKDVRYGGRGVGVAPEPCKIRIIDVSNITR